MDHLVYVLAVFDDSSGPALFAGGVSANRVARWDGTNWSALSSGLGNQVHALEGFDDGTGLALFAGGEFVTAGGNPANHIAKWDGNAWSPLGSGTNGDVLTLKVFDDGTGAALYAGGNFTMAEGVSASRIAKWDGSTWSALGNGVGAGVVKALTVFDDGTGPALYAGGQFLGAGVIVVNNIAKWDGSAWSSLGGGVIHTTADATVNALAVSDDGTGAALYAGGLFESAGGTPAVGLAAWNGTTWSALESGVNNIIHSVVAFDDGNGPALYAGGKFSVAGGIVSTNIAKWTCTPICIPADCKGHGTCVNGVCICDMSYSGEACDQCAPDFYNYPNCVFCQASVTCSDHGTCNSLGACGCEVEYEGAACDQCAADHYNYPTCTYCEASVTCSGSGTCNPLGECDCDCGCIGAACDQCTPCQLYGDVEPAGLGDCDVDVDDILLVLDAFSGMVPVASGDIEPCIPDGDADVDDILAVLDAFSGTYACPPPCSP